MEPPEDEDQRFDECSSEWSDLDEHIIGPEQFTDQGESDVAHAPGHGQESAEAPATDQADEQPADSRRSRRSSMMRWRTCQQMRRLSRSSSGPVAAGGGLAEILLA